jgi:hypothetical protein
MALQSAESVPVYNQRQSPAEKPVSPFWWFLPFFLGVIGGLIAFAALQKNNRGMARRLLIFGVAWTALVVMSYVTSNLA